jgi:hypothetical protein
MARTKGQFSRIHGPIFSGKATAERDRVPRRGDQLLGAAEPVLTLSGALSVVEGSEDDEHRALGVEVWLDLAVRGGSTALRSRQNLSQATTTSPAPTVQDKQAVGPREAIGALAKAPYRMASLRRVATRDARAEIEDRPRGRLRAARCGRWSESD